MKTQNPDLTSFSEEKGVFETENPFFRVYQKHGSHPYPWPQNYQVLIYIGKSLKNHQNSPVNRVKNRQITLKGPNSKSPEGSQFRQF